MADVIHNPPIGALTGAAGVSGFSREFKEFTGHTPAEYVALRRRLPAEPGFPPDRGPVPAD
jgi:hypothetical protein